MYIGKLLVASMSGDSNSRSASAGKTNGRSISTIKYEFYPPCTLLFCLLILMRSFRRSSNRFAVNDSNVL